MRYMPKRRMIFVKRPASYRFRVNPQQSIDHGVNGQGRLCEQLHSSFFQKFAIERDNDQGRRSWKSQWASSLHGTSLGTDCDHVHQTQEVHRQVFSYARRRIGLARRGWVPAGKFRVSHQELLPVLENPSSKDE